MANGHGHGGSRVGSGRKPKALRYAQDVAAAEAKIVMALPRLLEALITQGLAGDVSAGG